MLVQAVLGLSLAVNVSIDMQSQDRQGTEGPGAGINMSLQQKNAALRPLVRSATECVARTVVASPRFSADDNDISELIVDSMTSCVEAMRAMIDGSGTGRVGTPYDIADAAAFLLGPDASFITGTDLLVDGGVVAAVSTGQFDPRAGR